MFFYEKDTEKIKINTIAEKNKYEIELSFIEFKNLNKYFKMFETIKELEDDLIRLSNSKKIVVSKILENELDLCINVLTLDNNKVILHLKKAELNDKEKINLILKENEEIKKENMEIKNDLKLKDFKINELEKKIEELTIQFLNFKKSFEEKLNNKNNCFNGNNTKNQNLKSVSYEDINFKSNIISNNNEKDLILNQISGNIKKIDLLFSSEVDGTDINKLKNAYLNKPNLVFIVKTKKGRRFAAYSKETFLDKEFKKYDSQAFLFSLDNKAIIKPKKSSNSIWSYHCDSIEFGGGTDLKIYYDFTSNKNYTNQVTKHYNYQNYPKFILNGEYYFSVDILEIFQIRLE